MFDIICWKNSGFLNYFCFSYVIRIFSQMKTWPDYANLHTWIQTGQGCLHKLLNPFGIYKGTQSQKNFEELLE